MKLILFIIVLVVFSACRLINPDLFFFPKSEKDFYFPPLSQEFINAQNDCIAKKKFPCDYSEPNDSLNESANKWYSKHLKSLKEPILYTQKNLGKKIIRFTNLGTLSHPVTYRVEFNNENIIGTFNKSSGQGGYKAGRRVHHSRKLVSKSHWEQIIAKVDSVNFWNISTHEKAVILDGEEWILEILMNEKYHFVIRTSPDIKAGNEFAQLCQLIMEEFNK